jgi:hypothetical protein
MEHDSCVVFVERASGSRQARVRQRRRIYPRAFVTMTVAMTGLDQSSCQPAWRLGEQSATTESEPAYINQAMTACL